METEKLNLVKILKKCPKNMTLYSPILGDVQFEIEDIGDEDEEMIVIAISSSYDEVMLNEDGHFCDDGELMLFPSKENRDWSTFKVPQKKVERFDPYTLESYDHILVRDNLTDVWIPQILSYVEGTGKFVDMNNCEWECAIPYKGNEGLALCSDSPEDEYFRYWEEEEKDEDG